MAAGTAARPWYAAGLRFECARCGNCCTGKPGTVRVSREEVAALASHLGLRGREFRARFTRRLPDGALSLQEQGDHACVFWDRDRGCTVYAHRPRQCRSWPFWRTNLATARHWAATARECPGIGHGPLHRAAEIAAVAARDGTSGVIHPA